MDAREETIAAIATAQGAGSIAVIRVSGSSSIDVVDCVFRGVKPLRVCAGHTAHHGFIEDARGERLDEVVATVFRAPHSYTGEDVVEVSCHGGAVMPRLVLNAILDAGARAAGPGEFTRRAFLRGKMDLAQAEAVMGLVQAESRAAGRASLAVLEGKLGERVRGMRSELLDLCALLETELDFSEEGLELVGREDVIRRIMAVQHRAAEMAARYERNRLLRSGLGVVLVGKPNAGKSSLFNALLREGRAIVTSHPGTTRDLLEESIEIDGVQIRLQDTAGLREAVDAAEEQGVERSRKSILGADVVVILVDPAEPLSRDESEDIKDLLRNGQQTIWVSTKADLRSAVVRKPKIAGERAWLEVSALTGEGLRELERTMLSFARSGEATADLAAATRRQQSLLGQASDALSRGVSAARTGSPNELIAFEVREASSSLGEITGEITSEDVLNRIFEQFCIGK